MNELITLIEKEIARTRFGVVTFAVTMHDGQIRCVNVTTTQRHNITPTKAKDICNGTRS